MARTASLAVLQQLLPGRHASAAPESVASDEEIREAVRKAFDKTAGKTKAGSSLLSFTDLTISFSRHLKKLE